MLRWRVTTRGAGDPSRSHRPVRPERGARPPARSVPATSPASAPPDISVSAAGRRAAARDNPHIT